MPHSLLAPVPAIRRLCPPALRSSEANKATQGCRRTTELVAHLGIIWGQVYNVFTIFMTFIRLLDFFIPTRISLFNKKMATDSQPTSFRLPDLVSHCTFPLVYHRDGDAIAQQSVKWLDNNCPDLSSKQRTALYGLQAGELTAYCYNTTSPGRLRVVSDFMNYLFHL